MTCSPRLFFELTSVFTELSFSAVCFDKSIFESVFVLLLFFRYPTLSGAMRSQN